MIEIILYLMVGLISGFITYWISYRLTKSKLLKERDSKWRVAPKHEDVKGRVLEDDMIPIILSIMFWPLALLVIYPLIIAVLGVCKTFNWIIDKIEGGKYSDSSSKD